MAVGGVTLPDKIGWHMPILLAQGDLPMLDYKKSVEAVFLGVYQSFADDVL